jgi:hypothetical protein
MGLRSPSCPSLLGGALRTLAALVALAAAALPARDDRDPDAPQWRAFSSEHAPAARLGAVSVWTGTELIVWGGFTDAGERYAVRGDGGRLDPATGAWRPLPGEGAPSARGWHAAVWTGDEMIVWGGEADGVVLGDGAAYSPHANRWRRVADAGAPAPRVEHSAVWTGREMLVLGGDLPDGSLLTSYGRAYDPAADAWRVTATPPGLVNAP